MKIIKIDEEGIEFDNGSTLYDYHDQDCCEHVYADWMNMVAMTESDRNDIIITNYDFFDNILDSIVPIEGLGFYLVTQQGMCIRVDCYNKQNGYYSSNLELNHYSKDGKLIAKDISKAVQDEIY